MEEPVRMMLLDAVFTDAPVSSPACPPSVLLYGLNSEGVSIAVHVKDFVPYFWFPAPVCEVDGKVVSLNEGRLDTVKEHLNRKVLASRKKTGVSCDQFIASITVEYRTPLMYYRHGGPFLFLKLGMRFFCDTAIAGGSWVEIKQAKPILHDQQKTRCSKELVASWRNLIGLTADATNHMEFTESAASVSSVPCNSEEFGMSKSRDIILDLDDQSDTSLPDEEDLRDFTQIKSKVSVREQPKSRDSSSSDPSLPSTSGKTTWNLIAPLRILSLHVQCSGGGGLLPETEEISISSPVKSGRGRGRGKGRGRPEPLVKPSTRVASGGIGSGSPGDMEASVTDIEGLTSLVGGGSAIPSRDPVLVMSHILRFPGHQDRTRKVVFT